MSTLEYRNGIATDTRDFILALDDFLLTQVGTWERVYKQVDTTTERVYIYKSVGSTPGLYRPLYVGWRGYSTSIYVYAYTYYDSAGSYTDIMPDANNIWAGVGTDFNYYLFADADVIWVLIQDTAGNWFFAHTGYFNSYYSNSVEEDYPVVVSASQYYYSFFTSSTTSAFYAPWSTTSGSWYTYVASSVEYTELLTYADPNDRTGETAIFPIIHYRSSYPVEVRGELRNAYMTGDNTISSGSWITMSGTGYKYLGYNYTGTSSANFIVGPIPEASGTNWL